MARLHDREDCSAGAQPFVGDWLRGRTAAATSCSNLPSLSRHGSVAVGDCRTPSWLKTQSGMGHVDAGATGCRRFQGHGIGLSSTPWY